MVNVLFARGNCGSWDQGLLLHAVSGRLWPMPVEFRQTMGLVPETPGGAVVVIAGRHLADEDGMRYVRAGLDKLPWSLIFHLGDEELQLPSEQLRYPARRLVIQCASAFSPIRGDRNICLGFPEDARAWLGQQARKATSGRKFLYSFSGQRNHVVRERMFDALEGVPGGLLNDTGGFGQGYSRDKYYGLLADTSIVLCPTGCFSPETFRMYEALEAGCLPIANRRATNGNWPPGFDYYEWLYPDTPFPTVDEWSGVTDILNFYRDEPARLQRDMTRCLAWWSGIKRAFALDLVDDVRALGGDVPVPPVSVVMTHAPMPSHPSNEVIEESIRRVRAYPELARAEVLVGIDGVRPDLEHRRDAYEESKRALVDKANWSEEWFGVCPVIFDEWTHQAGMTKRLLEMVRTPFILFVESDCFPLGDIPWAGLIRAFDDQTINYIRLHLFDAVHPEHADLYDGVDQRIGRWGVDLMQTRQYSQRPFLARTSWYREMLEKFFPGTASGFIEDRLHGPGQVNALGKLLIYAPDGSMLRSGTVDGRKDDPKAPVTR